MDKVFELTDSGTALDPAIEDARLMMLGSFAKTRQLVMREGTNIARDLLQFGHYRFSETIG